MIGGMSGGLGWPAGRLLCNESLDRQYSRCRRCLLRSGPPVASSPLISPATSSPLATVS